MNEVTKKRLLSLPYTAKRQPSYELRDLLNNINAPCESLPVELWVTNGGSTTVTVDEVFVGPLVFAVQAVNLPLEIPPRGFAAVTLAFLPNTIATIDGALVLKSEQGCARIPLRGRAVGLDEDKVISQNVDGVVYFGALLPGESSAPKTISFLNQASDGASESTAGDPGLISETEGAFTTVSPRGGERPLTQCDERSITIIFNAPETPGRYEGAIGWGTTSADNITSDMRLVVYGDTVEP